MSNGKGGFIGQDGLNAPDQATDVAGTAGDEQVSVAFTAPSDVGASAITGFRAQVGGVGTSGTSSPIVVTGLTNGTAYTANVWTINAFGTSAPSDASASFTPAVLDIAIFGTKENKQIEKVTFSTLGNSADYGELLHDEQNVSTCGNNVTAIFMGGTANKVDINSMTFATGGTASDFGDLTIGGRLGGGLSNNTRGVMCGGQRVNTINRIDYITIASAGNANDFGDCATRNDHGGHNSAGSTSTRGVYTSSGGGGSRRTDIEFITIGSTGNGSDFGDLSVARGLSAAVFNTTRMVIGGGDTNDDDKTNVIDYITMGSTGNATDFGDLSVARMDLGSASNATRGLFAGGLIYFPNSNTIDYITIGSTGNATDFGNLTRAQDGVFGASSSNPSQGS